MHYPMWYRARCLTAVLIALLLLPEAYALAPALETPAKSGSAPRLVDDGIDLLVPQGETYELCGCHTYTGRVEINGTLVVKPYDGSDESSGALVIQAPSIFIGIAGRVAADGRGYGGGGGGQSDSIPSPGGTGGVGGRGGSGAAATSGGTPTTKGGGGGGGSDGGRGGAGNAAGDDGTATGGGKGGTCSSAGGAGGTGYGGGGGGGGSSTISGGGGGGGGSGGESALGTTGGKGGGPWGGQAGPGTTGACSASQSGKNGGYMDYERNGDTTTELSVVRGSGGGGGGASSGYGGGAGGGGAGGAAVTLISDGELKLLGSITATGAGGGKGGKSGSITPDPDDKAPGPGPVPKENTGGSGGGGAGGGVALKGFKVMIGGTIDARGRQQDTLSTQNGGSVKIFYAEKLVTGTVQGGRVYYNGRPVVGGLLSPANGSYLNASPSLSWSPGTDPDGDPLSYHLQLATDPGFATVLIDERGLSATELAPPEALEEGRYWWRVRAEDAHGFGLWTSVWEFTVDSSPPISTVSALPVYTTSLSLKVSWSASDATSGVAGVSVYMMVEGRGYTIWQENTLKTCATLDAEEGCTYSFYSVARDRAGNEEEAPEGPDASTTIDTTPPSSSMSPLSGYQTVADFTVSWSGRDTTSGVEGYTVYVSTDGGPFSAWLEGTANTSALYRGEGGHEYAFYVRARDRAGLVEPEPSPERVVRTRVDTSAPKTTVTVGQPRYGEAPIYVTPSTGVLLSARDDYSGVAGVLYIIDDGEPQTYSSPIKLSEGGHHNISWWSEDLAGNREAEGTLWVFVDGEAPVTAAVVQGRSHEKGGQRYVQAGASISLEARDAGSGVARTEAGLDGAGYEPYAGPITVSGSGSHTLRFRSVDNLGNWETDKELVFVVDSAPPSTSAYADAGGDGDRVIVTLQAQDSQSGVASTWYRVLKGGSVVQDWTEGTSAAIPAPRDHSGDGSYTIEFYSIDNVGNREETGRKELLVDTFAELYTDQEQRVAVGKERYVLEGRVEPGSSVTINGQSVNVKADGSFSAELKLKEGRNEIELTVRDPMGNERTETYYIDYSRPASGGDLPLPLIVGAAAALAAVGGAALVIYRRRSGTRSPRARTGPQTGSPLPQAESSAPPLFDNRRVV
ncbi:MAG: OmpL47-type beta-barrel domain-containing protein [Thermoplasmatota archaeon]